MAYKTSDIVLAAFLRLNGCEIARIEKDGYRGTFVFDNQTTNVEEFVHQYDLGKARVEPIAFNNMIRTLTTAVRRTE